MLLILFSKVLNINVNINSISIAVPQEYKLYNSGMMWNENYFSRMQGIPFTSTA